MINRMHNTMFTRWSWIDKHTTSTHREWQSSEVMWLSRPWRTQRKTKNCCGRVWALGSLLVVN